MLHWVSRISALLEITRRLAAFSSFTIVFVVIFVSFRPANMTKNRVLAQIWRQRPSFGSGCAAYAVCNCLLPNFARFNALSTAALPLSFALA
jgi:hypothetical protein